MDRIRLMEERFTYDNLNRLTGIVEGLDTTGVFAYDDYGRMTMKYIHGDTVFDQTAYNAGGRPHALMTARMHSYQPDMAMSYTSFDKLRHIQTGNMSLSYRYGYEHRRLRMDEMVGNDTVRTKIYAGSCEHVTEGNGTYSTSYWLTFISGPLGVFAVRDTRMQPAPKQMYYVHPDHLGSWTTVTGRNGKVVQDVWFDPWGTPYYSDSSHLVQAASLFFDRGFTGHEHMAHFGLINMNGRVYDPVTSTFLSVDNYVQDPSYTQNFNRYAYCMNNPLKYTDPDGEWAHLVIGALVGGIVNLATNWGHINTFGEGLAYFGIGATAGALSAGVGLGVSSWIGGGSFGAGFIGSTAAKTAVSSFASGSVIGGSTGFTQGFITGSGNSWMQENTFGQGLLQGIYSGAAGLVNGAIHGGISGGLDAMANGREFWSGDYVETISRDYPVGPNYTQPDGSKDCVVTVAKTIDHYHGGKTTSRFLRDKFWIEDSDPMSCGIIDYQFWDGFAPYEGMSCEELDAFSISKIYKAFSEGADIPITIGQGTGNDYHELLIRKMAFRIHQEWFSGNINKSYQSWVQDPAIGYMLPKVFSFDNVVRVFILKPLTP